MGATGVFGAYGADPELAMLEVNRRIHIPDDEFHWSYARSGGPGGQNVNKVASKAVLRWDVTNTPSLPADVKTRLLAELGVTVQDRAEQIALLRAAEALNGNLTAAATATLLLRTFSSGD